MLSGLRYALRSLSRSPWYSGTVIGVVALGLALTATVFAVVDGVLFKPLPFVRPYEVYAVSGGWLEGQRGGVSVSARDLRDWAAAVPEVQFGASGFAGTYGRIGNFDTRELATVAISPGFLDVLGVRPLLGGFSAGDYGVSAETPQPVLISYSLWQRVYGGRTDAVGKTLDVVGVARPPRVAGVLPAGFVFPASRSQPDLLFPLVLTPKDFESRASRRLSLIARVPKTARFADVQARLDAAAAGVVSDFPANSRLVHGAFTHVAVDPVETILTSQARPTFVLILSAAAVLMLLACVNLAGLGAARAEDRMRDIALRRALGAGTWRLARVPIVESAVLAAMGVIGGLASAPLVLRTTLRLLPENTALLKAPALDLRVVLFAAGAAVLVTLLVSAWPAAVATRSGLAILLMQGGPSTTRAGRISRRLLVAGQVAIGVTLTIGGTLVVGSLVTVWRQDPGYTRADTVLVEARVAGRGDNNAAIRARSEEFARAVKETPGLVRVATFDGPFLERSTRADVSWRVPPGASRGCLSGPKVGVSAGFFDVMNIRAVAGRVLSSADVDNRQMVAVVSRRQAEACWPGRSPIGQALSIADLEFTVVGVVPDVRFGSLDEATRSGSVFVSNTVFPAWGDAVIAGTLARPFAEVLPALMGTLSQRNLLARVSSIKTVDDALADTIRPRRLNAWLFGAFAVAALVIVGVGILGLVLMTTATRTREMGIRFALGATRVSVATLLLREQVVSVVVGLCAGGCFSWWAVRFVQAYLYQLTAYDPRVWVIAMLAILVTAAIGTLVPSLRASRVDPVRALRAE